jgi:hypothetical protein
MPAGKDENELFSFLSMLPQQTARVTAVQKVILAVSATSFNGGPVFALRCSPVAGFHEDLRKLIRWPIDCVGGGSVRT